jgi:hypothetical protein
MITKNVLVHGKKSLCYKTKFWVISTRSTLFVEKVRLKVLDNIGI